MEDNKIVVICFDFTVLTELEDLLGILSNFVMVSENVQVPITFIGSSAHAFCSECQMTP